MGTDDVEGVEVTRRTSEEVELRSITTDDVNKEPNRKGDTGTEGEGDGVMLDTMLNQPRRSQREKKTPSYLSEYKVS